MKKEIAMAWADELESGKYKQGQGRLRRKNNEFCCLGVLCNMHAIAHPEFAKTQIDPNNYEGKSAWLGKKVLAWSGMKTSYGYIDGIKNIHSLANINDNGSNFNQIAEIIRKHYEKL